MNWSKVKIVLIIFLVVLNVFLFMKLSEIYTMSGRLPDGILEEASENLLSRGIKISPEVIDNKHYDKDIYTFSAKKLTSDYLSELSHNSIYEKAFRSLFSAEEYTVRYFDIPDGVSATVSVPGGEVLGFASITGDFGIEYYTPGVDTQRMSELSKELAEGVVLAPSHSAKKAINSFFSSVYGGSQMSFITEYSRAYNSGELVECTLTLAGTPLCDMSLRFYVKDGEIVYFKGSLPQGDARAEYHNELIDSVNILFYLDTAGDIEIISQDFCYSAVKFDSESFLAVPAWHFTIMNADGSLSHSVYDAVAGTKIK